MMSSDPRDWQKSSCKVSAWLHWTPLSPKSYILTFPYYLFGAGSQNWGAISQVAVLILPQTRLSLKLSSYASFFSSQDNVITITHEYLDQNHFHRMCVCVLTHFGCLRLIAPQASLSMGFCRQEYWTGLSCPPPGDLPDPGIEPASLTSNLHWQVGSLPLGPLGNIMR